MSGDQKSGSVSLDNPDRAKLREHFKNHEAVDHTKRWEDLWQQEFVPWDRGSPSPALVDILTDRSELLPPPLNADGNRKRALVPGCGRGYDVLLLSSFGYDAYGLEASNGALEACRKLEAEGRKEYDTRSDSVGKGKVTWVSGDYFQDEWKSRVEESEKGFDLIYDYTFLCALPYELRPRWAQRQSELLAHDGRLVCLEFPTTKPPSLGGPPWALPPLVYQELLRRPGEDISYDDGGAVLETNREPSRGELRRVAHWQPERTHPVGQGTDWVSVWQHS